MPALMGEGSSHGAIIAALERGQALGGGGSGSNGAEEAMERARPHVARSRRLMAVWARLELPHRRVLAAHYCAPPRSRYRPGVHAHLGELAGVCELLTPIWQSLELACSNAAQPRHSARIARELARARRAISAAHRAWRSARGQAVLTWASG